MANWSAVSIIGSGLPSDRWRGLSAVAGVRGGAAREGVPGPETGPEVRPAAAPGRCPPAAGGRVCPAGCGTTPWGPTDAGQRRALQRLASKDRGPPLVIPGPPRATTRRVSPLTAYLYAPLRSVASRTASWRSSTSAMGSPCPERHGPSEHVPWRSSRDATVDTPLQRRAVAMVSGAPDPGRARFHRARLRLEQAAHSSPGGRTATRMHSPAGGPASLARHTDERIADRWGRASPQ
jgi:hypothetical protein